MAHDVVLIPGDGIGPEITQAMRRVVEAAGVQINWNVQEAGAGVMDEFGTPLPQHVLDAVAETKVAIKGPITTPVGTGFRSVNVALRKHFDLYACVRPCLSQPGDGSRFRDVDLVIVRENTEDLYAGIEFDEGAAEVEELSQLVERSGQKTFAADSAISIKPISIAKSRRIVEYAFEYARRCGRKKGDGRAHGQHHEGDRRPVPARGARGGRQLSRYRVQRQDRRRYLHGPGPESQ